MPLAESMIWKSEKKTEGHEIISGMTCTALQSNFWHHFWLMTLTYPFKWGETVADLVIPVPASRGDDSYVTEIGGPIFPPVMVNTSVETAHIGVYSHHWKAQKSLYSVRETEACYKFVYRVRFNCVFWKSLTTLQYCIEKY